MDSKQFRKEAHKLVEWMADYIENVRRYPVKPDIDPGNIRNQIPPAAPEKGEDFKQIFKDFEDVIMPGMTHWEHPKFMGYFPANKSYPSVLAEMLTATLGAQCMSWITSPAATELEEIVMDWLRKMIGLPDEFTGVIQDTASTSTLVALLMAREKKTDFRTNQSGFPQPKKLTVYCSRQTHSSIEKDVKIAGYGNQQLRKVRTDNRYRMKPAKLEESIKNDLNNGHKPTCVVATLGTTGSTAIDPLKDIARICERYEVFLHVDAAFAGTALLLPEMRWMIEGITSVDSFVFNPHKWMFTNFDCSAFYVKEPNLLVNTFKITPEYLKAAEDDRVKNYRDWGIQLGRRFRALKLWFVIRNFGVEGLKEKIRNHIKLAEQQAEIIDNHSDFMILAPVPLNTICFRFSPSKFTDEDLLNQLNSRLLECINKTGDVFLTHTRLDGRYTLRMVIGNTNVTEKDVRDAWEIIQNEGNKLIK